MYKTIVTGLLIATAAVWAVDDAGNVGSAVHDIKPPPTPINFDVTVLNTFECSYAQHILGMDINSGGNIIFSSALDDKIYACNPGDGTYLTELDCTYTGAPSNFGCGFGNSGTYVSDWSLTNLYFWNSSWNTYPSPSGNTYIRGLDYTTGSTDYLWGGYSNGMSTPRGCYRMSPDLSTSDFIDFPEVPTQISGITWFDYGSGEGILCTTYDTHNFYFYTISGTTATLEGTIVNPVTSNGDYMGLAYSSTRDTVFLSYVNSSVSYISELDIDVSTSIKSASLGEIKAILK